MIFFKPSLPRLIYKRFAWKCVRGRPIKKRNGKGQSLALRRSFGLFRLGNARRVRKTNSPISECLGRTLSVSNAVRLICSLSVHWTCLLSAPVKVFANLVGFSQFPNLAKPNLRPTEASGAVPLVPLAAKRRTK